MKKISQLKEYSYKQGFSPPSNNDLATGLIYFSKIDLTTIIFSSIISIDQDQGQCGNSLYIRFSDSLILIKDFHETYV